MNKTFSREFVSLCETRLAEITDEDSAALLQFAECRLVEHGASLSYAEDITQRAFEAVLVGLHTTQRGRKPRMRDVVNKGAFLNYMRGVVSSLLFALIRKKEFCTAWKEWYDNARTTIGTEQSPAHQAELEDLRNQLFPRLRSRAPRRLLRTINAWERVFLHSDRIPAPGHRRYVREVRTLAQEVMLELGAMRRK